MATKSQPILTLGDKGCMMSECEKCKNHSLVISDFVNLVSDASDSQSENTELTFIW